MHGQPSWYGIPPLGWERQDKTPVVFGGLWRQWGEQRVLILPGRDNVVPEEFALPLAKGEGRTILCYAIHAICGVEIDNGHVIVTTIAFYFDVITHSLMSSKILKFEESFFKVKFSHMGNVSDIIEGNPLNRLSDLFTKYSGDASECMKNFTNIIQECFLLGQKPLDETVAPLNWLRSIYIKDVVMTETDYEWVVNWI